MKAPKKRYIFKTDKNRESFQRWSDHRIEQLTAAISLMFAISSAALGYTLTLFSDDKTSIEKIATWPFVLLILAFLVSFIFGILVVFNRLRSFRETCEIIKLRDQPQDSDALDEGRDENDETDSRTWTFFLIQFFSFILGGFLFFIYTFSSNWERLKMVLSRLL
jgi:VIT1/CCC1 family predicted Fe2+/Mn2+ transporter